MYAEYRKNVSYQTTEGLLKVLKFFIVVFGWNVNSSFAKYVSEFGC